MVLTAGISFSKVVAQRTPVPTFINVIYVTWSISLSSPDLLSCVISD